MQEAPFTITSLAPSDEMIDMSNKRLSKLLDGSGKKLEQKNNDVSVALLLEYGSLSVVLGGDVSKDGWSTALKRLTDSPRLVEAVKASHHGSENDYSAEFWARCGGVAA